MGTFKTGRTTTPTAVYTIAGHAHAEVRHFPSFVAYPGFPAYTTPVFNGAWVSMAFTASGTADQSVTGTPPPDPNNFHATWSVCATVTGGTVCNTFTTTVPWASFDNYVYDLDVAGSCTMSIDCEECVEITDIGFNALDIGTQRIDPPAVLYWRLFLRSKVGGTETCAVSSGGASVTATHTTTSAIEIAVLADQWCASGVVDLTSFCRNATASLSPLSVVGVNIGAPNFDAFDTNHDANCENGAVASVRATTSTDAAYYRTVAGLFAMPPLIYNVSVRANALGKQYPDNLTAILYEYQTDPGTLLSVPAGAGTVTFQQQRYQAGANFWIQTTPTGPLTVPVGYIGPVNQLWPVTWKWQTASLAAVGEDTDLAPTLRGRGPIWNALTMTQAASVDADPGAQTAHWTAGAHTTLANSGGAAMTATVDSTGPGSLSTALPVASGSLTNGQWLGVDFSGYAFLRLFLTAGAAGQSAKVVIGSKTWNLTVGTSGSLDIALCHPDSTFVSTDAKDTQWPWSAIPYSVSDSQMWGVSNVTNLTISGLAASQVYTLGKIQLVRKDHSLMSFMPTFKGWTVAFPPVVIGSVTTTTYYRRGRWADTDARQSREDTDWFWLHEVSSGTPTDIYNPITILSMISNLHTGGIPPRGGWDATDLHPNDSSDNLRDGWLNSDNDSAYLYGAGLEFDGTNWVSGLDKDCSGTPSIPAQVIFDQILTYPECGDVIGNSGGAFGGGMTLALGSILRGNFWGAEFDNTGPATGATVTVTKVSDGSAAGDATSVATTGEYYKTSIVGTGLPYGKGLVNYNASAVIGAHPAVSLNRAFLSRHRHRAMFAYPVATPPSIVNPELIWTWRDYTQRLFVWLCDPTTLALNVFVYDDLDTSPVSFVVDPSMGCTWPSYYLAEDRFDGTHLDGTVAIWGRSGTHGRTWTLTTIPSTYSYDACTSAIHRVRLVFCGHHTNDPMTMGDPATGWYVHVGALQDDGSYVWNAGGGPVAMGITPTMADAHLRSRDDGTLEFTYVDDTPSVQIVRAYNLALDGTGSWS